MGKPKNRWTSEEEAGLEAGVGKYGASKWKEILKDPEFAYILQKRSNVDLKDKWRNVKSYDAPQARANAPREQQVSGEIHRTITSTTNNKLRLLITIIAIVAWLGIGIHINIWNPPTVLRFFENFLDKSWRSYEVIGNMKEHVQVHGMT